MDEIGTLKIWTSYATSGILEYFVEQEILPLFIARTIRESGLIGGWQGTPIHFPQLAPSPTLLRDWKYNNLGDKEFEEQYFQELDNLDIEKIFKKFSLLQGICQAKGVVLIGYGSDPTQDHRYWLMKYLNRKGAKIQEYNLW